MHEEGEIEMPTNGNGTRNTWLMGVLALALCTAAGWGVNDARTAALEARSKVNDLKEELAVLRTQQAADRSAMTTRLDDLAHRVEAMDERMNSKLDRLLMRRGENGR